MNNIKNTIVDLLHSFTQGGAVHGVFPNMDTLVRFLAEKKNNAEVVRIFYGETYDRYGITIDSLKYYFFLSLFCQALQKEGINAVPTVCVADIAAVLNLLVLEKEQLLEKAIGRIGFLEKVNVIYGTNLHPVLMSDIHKREDYKIVLKAAQPVVTDSKKIQRLFQKTVLVNRLKQERETQFRYATEEVATSLLFDIKVGPPREFFYDQAARIAGETMKGRKLHGIYLSPTYPLGKNFDFFISNPEIDMYGVTPYKAGSNKLQDNRIILGVTSMKRIEELIMSSFMPEYPGLANPVFDLFVIADFARRFLEKDFSSQDAFLPDCLDEKALRQRTLEYVHAFIFDPLYGGSL